MNNKLIEETKFNSWISRDNSPENNLLNSMSTFKNQFPQLEVS
jgi:hypothetical protein